jgi:periplasmic copper chaperone A
MNHLLTIARSLFAATLLNLSAASLAHAHGFTLGDIHIAHPYASATVQGQSVGGVFFKAIENKGAAADKLLAASVNPSFAERTELHTMNTENDVMRMRQVKAIDIPAKTSVPMTRGLHKNGYHVMLMDLKAPLKVGDKLPLTLTFKKAGTVEVMVYVEALKSDSPMPNHAH